MKPVVLHPAAEQELNEAIQYCESDRPGRGTKFRDEFDRTVSLIQAVPGIGPRHGRSRFRRFRVKHFPYIIYYQEFSDFIWVPAICHGKREPDYWIARKPRY